MISEEESGEGRSHERRKRNIPVAVDRRKANAAEKRRSSERRRLIDPTTCERDYTDEETAFMKAMERFKRENRRPFPTWTEVLEVLHSVGYRKTSAETDLPGVKRPDPSPPGEAPLGAERRKRNIPVPNTSEMRHPGETRHVEGTHPGPQQSHEEIAFMEAMERYKRVNRRPFPTWSEVLEVLASLGYRKTDSGTDDPGISQGAVTTLQPS
jgi:hypothetical protein